MEYRYINKDIPSTKKQIISNLISPYPCREAKMGKNQMGSKEYYREMIMNHIEYNSKKCTNKGEKAVELFSVSIV